MIGKASLNLNTLAIWKTLGREWEDKPKTEKKSWNDTFDKVHLSKNSTSRKQTIHLKMKKRWTSHQVKSTDGV